MSTTTTFVPHGGTRPVIVPRNRWHDELTLRMLGDNVTLMRTQWADLLDSLREDSELAGRIRNLIAAVAERS